MILSILAAIVLDTALVVGVHDGDTLTLQDSCATTYRCRLYGIDAPELKQRHGVASRDALMRAVGGEVVWVAPAGSDRYRRAVARVYKDTEDICLWMVSQGHAWHYVDYARKDSALTAAERHARSERIGLWASPRPLAPWRYRAIYVRKKIQSALLFVRKIYAFRFL